MAQFRLSRAGLMLLLAGAVAGFVLALYAYFAPLTGVTGTLGALAVIVACAVLAVMALALGRADTCGARVTLRVLIVIVLLATCFAALLLHRWWICVAMGLGLIGVIIELFRPAGVHRTARS